MLGSKVILIVDDTPITLMSTAFTLRSLGYYTGEAASGLTALGKIQTGDYAAVLMDLRMPKMDGIECAIKIRAMERDSGRRIPIIAFSSEREADVKQGCLDAGMDAFLDKACSPELLGETLNLLIAEVPSPLDHIDCVEQDNALGLAL